MLECDNERKGMSVQGWEWEEKGFKIMKYMLKCLHIGKKLYFASENERNEDESLKNKKWIESLGFENIIN